MNCTYRVDIREKSQVYEARNIALRLGTEMNETSKGKVTLIVTEMATNLLKHIADGGYILLNSRSCGIDIISVDSGDGMDVEVCLEDGYSTAGSPGIGLGAIARLSSFVDIYSVHGSGTVMVSHVCEGKTCSRSTGFVCLPKPGEQASGDMWGLVSDRVMVSDGLGHGIEAAKASREALAVFVEDASPQSLLTSMHAALRSTRGAAIAIAKLDKENEHLIFAGVGNISGAIIFNQERKNLISHEGTVGYHLRRIEEFVYRWPKGALLVLHSDGISNRWLPENYPGLWMQDPTLIAAVLYRDCFRGRDDVAVIVVPNA